LSGNQSIQVSQIPFGAQTVTIRICGLLSHYDSFFKDIQINELPSLIYQLILLANKGSNDVKTTLLRGIAHHLENLGKEYDQE